MLHNKSTTKISAEISKAQATYDAASIALLEASRDCRLNFCAATEAAAYQARDRYRLSRDRLAFLMTPSERKRFVNGILVHPITGQIEL